MLIVIAGPSCVGKTTIVNKLIKERPDLFSFAVSHTSRKPRNGETNNIDYHFISADEFVQMIVNDEFIEHACYAGNYYGMSKKEVEKISADEKNCIIINEVNGVKMLKSKNIPAKFICILPPSTSILRDRLKIRGDKNVEDRMKICEQELSEYPNLNFDITIVNDNLDVSCEKIIREFSI